MKRELAYLDDILECIGKLETYVEDTDESVFDLHTAMQDAMAHNLCVISHAVGQLSFEIQQKQPQIAWSHFARIQDKFFRHYFRTEETRIIWSIVTQDLPLLKVAVIELLKELDV
jgi:uncharacterized protein with HEPN domain